MRRILEFVVTMAFVVHRIHGSQHQMPYINLTIMFAWLISEMKGLILFSASVVLAVLVTVRWVQWGSQSWWRHPMEIFSPLLVLLCGEFTGEKLRICILVLVRLVPLGLIHTYSSLVTKIDFERVYWRIFASRFDDKMCLHHKSNRWSDGLAMQMIFF